MSEALTDTTRWTRADVELLPEHEGVRYEIIDGELFMTHAPHWNHQRVCGNIYVALHQWSLSSRQGEPSLSPGLLFSESDDVIPDVVWISKERLSALIDQAGHLTGAPELVVEVLSSGVQNERRDREAKLKLYQVKGVREYWIVDWRIKQVEIYRRERAQLRQVETLTSDDELTTPLLANFACNVSQFFL